MFAGTSRRVATLGWPRAFAVALALCAGTVTAFEAAALTAIPSSSFSPSATRITFEDLGASAGNLLPAGYGSGSGVSFTAGTYVYGYSVYGSTLANVANAAGLGSLAGTFGCDQSCGTGFGLATPQQRVGVFLSSNVPVVNVPVSAYRGATLLGTTLFNSAADTIGFVGFEDAGGIDRIAIGDNASCSGCVHQMDDVLFENLVARVASVPVPATSREALAALAALIVLAAAFASRRADR